jgi:hypothetical protein
MWRLTETGLRVEPIPGIPWRSMTDEEFAAAEAEIDARFPDQPGALRRSPFFYEEKLESTKPPKDEPEGEQKEITDGQS